MSKKRASAYFEARLKRDFSKIYADLRAGKFKSVRQAAAAAGLIHLPTRFDALKREWKRANAKERGDFTAWQKGLAPTKAPFRSTKISIIDAMGHLKPAVINFIRDWTVVKRIKPGRIMKEIGFSNFDYTLSHALKRGAPLRNAVVVPLENWLVRNGFK
jgi:hypothetical protein